MPNHGKALPASCRRRCSRDLHRFGLIPEFIGRFPVITFLEELDAEALVRVLTEPRNALVRQSQQSFS